MRTARARFAGAVPGFGKSGGVRVIYFNLSAREVVLLVAAYGKAERSNMLPVEIDKVV